MRYTTKSGFTIIELTIYIGLLGLLLTMLSQVFFAILSVKVESEQHSVVESDAKYILSRISYDIHRATEITAPVLGQTTSTLRLLINENGSDEEYVYSLQNSRLSLSVSGVSQPISSSASGVTQFSVTHNGNSQSISDAKDTIQLLMTIDDMSDVSAGQEPYSIQTTVGLR
jgi:type II secretory pathway pseudopilin PulG